MEKKVDIIQSQRTFGVEIECGNENASAIDLIVRKHSNFVRAINDSSITLTNGKEFVTNVLQGSTGAKKIITLCDSLKELNFITDDISCGMHVHFDGADFQNKSEMVVVDDNIEKLISVKKDVLNQVLFVSDNCVVPYLVKKETGKPAPYIKFAQMIERSVGNFKEINVFGNSPVFVVKDEIVVEKDKFPVYKVSEVDLYDKQIADIVRQKQNHFIEKEYIVNSKKPENIALGIANPYTKKWLQDKKDYNFSKYKEKIKKLMDFSSGKYVAVFDDVRPLNRLKTLMYFYIGFNDVFQGMVAPSRKDGNAYCMPISDFFELEQVEKIKTYKEFERLWYKENDDGRIRNFKTDHYNDSRYLDVNLHCLWNRTETIEIRLHGSTKDANKILLWTALHQHILDKISKQEITLESIKYALPKNSDLPSKYEAMNSLLNLSEPLQLYVKRLLNHFSGLNLK